METIYATRVVLRDPATKIHPMLLYKIFIYLLFFFAFSELRAQVEEPSSLIGLRRCGSTKQNTHVELKLLEFKAVKTTADIQVSWILNREITRGSLILLRSFDAVTFDELVRFYANNNSETGYDWHDRSLFGKSKVYYRLTYRDENGIESTLGNTTLILELDKTVLLQPNPTKNKCLIQFEAGMEDASASVQLFDSHAKLMNSTQLAVIRGLNSTEIDLEHFPAGIYLIHIIMNSGNEVARIVKY